MPIDRVIDSEEAGLIPVDLPTNTNFAPPWPSQPTLNPFLRAPLPGLGLQPDILRNFYNTAVDQSRIGLQPGQANPTIAQSTVAAQQATAKPAPTPISLSGVPIPPTMTELLTKTGVGYEFKFQLGGLFSATDGANIYRNTVNNVSTATKINHIARDPTNTFAVYLFTDVAPSGTTYFYWATGTNSKGQESLAVSAQTGAIVSGALHTSGLNLTSGVKLGGDAGVSAIGSSSELGLGASPIYGLDVAAQFVRVTAGAAGVRKNDTNVSGVERIDQSGSTAAGVVETFRAGTSILRSNGTNLGIGSTPGVHPLQVNGVDMILNGDITTQYRPQNQSASVAGKFTGSTIFASGTVSNPGTGWIVAATSVLDIPTGVSSLTFAMVGSKTGTTGAAEFAAIGNNVGFSITSGAGPATPQVSGAIPTGGGSANVTITNPVVGSSLTLTVYFNNDNGGNATSLTVSAQQGVYQPIQRQNIT